MKRRFTFVKWFRLKTQSENEFLSVKQLCFDVIQMLYYCIVTLPQKPWVATWLERQTHNQKVIGSIFNSHKDRVYAECMLAKSSVPKFLCGDYSSSSSACSYYEVQGSRE